MLGGGGHLGIFSTGKCGKGKLVAWSGAAIREIHPHHWVLCRRGKGRAATLKKKSSERKPLHLLRERLIGGKEIRLHRRKKKGGGRGKREKEKNAAEKSVISEGRNRHVDVHKEDRCKA